MGKIILIAFASAMFYPFCVAFGHAVGDKPEVEAVDYGDFQRISVYSAVIAKDSVSYSARSAIYDPINGSVTISGSQYVIEPNDTDIEGDDSTSSFSFRVGEYYTNLD